MEYQLTPEQSQLWEEGGWSAYRIEEDILEAIERHHIHEAVVVMLNSGAVAFGITQVVQP
jgi:hypothetical protein